jgi:uncharacterized protein YkwD
MKTQFLLALGFMFLAGCASDEGDEETKRVGTPGDPEDLSSANPNHCAPTADWDPAWVELEEQVLRAVNAERARGATCGGSTYSPTHALLMDPALQCAARLHSKDMADRDFFSHDNPSGEDPWERIDAAGFTGFAGGENIAAGRSTAEDTVEQWMGSSGHCANIMNPDFQFIGVGYSPGGQYDHLWTQTFGNSGNR